MGSPLLLTSAYTRRLVTRLSSERAIGGAPGLPSPIPDRVPTGWQPASHWWRIDALTSERKGDVTIVKLGASERYEIPDALVTGG